MAILSISGKTPTLKDRLINQDNQREKKGFNNFKIKTGMLLDPEDFLESKASIKFSISPGTEGIRKKKKN